MTRMLETSAEYASLGTMGEDGHVRSFAYFKAFFEAFQMLFESVILGVETAFLLMR